MAFYGGSETDYGNMAVKSLANDIEAMLVALFPEVARADVRLRKKFVLAFAKGIITHIDQHVQAHVEESLLRLTDTARVVVEAPVIQLGAGATEPGVFGKVLWDHLKDLKEKYDEHQHGLSGPPSVLAPAPPDEMLSSKVKLG